MKDFEMMHNVNPFRKNLLAAVLTVVLPAGVCPAESASAEPAAYIVAGAGIVGIADHDKKEFIIVELQPAWRIGPLGTWIAFQTTDQEIYMATGLFYHWRITDRVFIAPSIGVGIYGEDNGIDLGYPVEFRSGVECGYDFKKAGRISVGGWHISNARLNDINPGTELVAVRYALPLSWR